MPLLPASLRARLLIFIAAAFLLLFVLGVITALQQWRAALESSRSEVSHIASLAAANQQRILEGTRQVLDTLARAPDVRSFDSERCARFLKPLAEGHQWYRDLGVIGVDGYLHCRTGPLRRVYLGDRDYFRNALRTADFSVGDLQLGRLSGRLSVNVGRPLLRDNGEPIGVLYAALDLDSLNRAAAEAPLPSGATLTIFDRKGVVIARNPEPLAWIGKPVLDRDLVAAALSGTAGRLEHDAGAEHRLVGYAPVGGLSMPAMFVAVEMREPILVNAVTGALIIFLAGLAAVTAIAMTLVWLASSALVVRPEQALDALAQLEKRYRTLVELSPESIHIHRDGRVVFVNSAGLRLFGADSPEQLIGRSVFELIHPDYHEFAKGRIELMQRGETLPATEQRMCRLDATVIDVEVSAASILDEGKPAVMVVLRDVTERNRVERDNRLRSDALEHALNGFDIIDGNGVFVYANQAYLRMWGYERLEEIIGASSAGHCADPTVPQQIIEHLLRKGHHTLEFTARRKDGSTFEVLMATHAFKSAQGEILYMGSSLDITERKRAQRALEESEHRFRQLAETAGEGIWIMDTHSQISFVNARICEMLGYRPEEMIGRYTLDFIDQAWHEPAQKQLELRRKGVSSRYELSLLRKDGTPLWTLISASPVMNPDGSYAGGLAMFTDISDLKSAQLRLEQVNVELEERVHNRTAQLQASNKELEAFAYSVSHDLRAPLRTIDGFSAALSEEYAAKLDSQAQDYMARIRGATARMGDLIEDLLELSRVSRVELRLQSVDLSAMA
ncbi:MAG: PAS domain S-box protein, partial [Burkholderiales bacterium]